ncbi:hypothetical protein [Streptomyces sp. NPDC056049]|uniref:hypothetical protein n=1 Tax=Streptomyces sp. NPDC056049 TaxID=3345693 RepID=UPI0035DA4D00
MPNFARSRGRSRRLHPISTRSTRNLLLVPALLAALVVPLLPEGTALAATASPVASTPAAASAEAAPATAEAVQNDPAPEPSATTDPTPTPTPTDTAEPCPALPLAPLGDPGDAVRQVTIEPGTTACFTVTVETPGTHRILIDGSHDTYPGLYAGEDRVTCDDWQYKDAWCDLAAGRYTLKLPNTDWQSAENRVALVPLMATAAGPCPAVPGTGYDTAPVTGTGVGPLGVVCHSFTAAPGERITQELRRETYGDADAWISDASGKHLCARSNQDGSEGCVLPEGTSGYRVHAVVGHQEDGSPAAPYTLEVRRLSDPAGCATVAPTVYGTAPDRSGAATGCKTFTPTVSGPHDVRAVDEDGNRSTVHVYAKDGTYACRSYDQPCALTAGTAYTVLTNEAILVLDRSSTTGCTGDVTLAALHQGTFAAPGAVNCLLLPVPQGARLAVLSDGSTDLSVVDANGTAFCGSGLTEGTCALGGTAPYRALVTEKHPGAEPDTYRLVVHRTDTASACRTFLPGDFSANPVRMSVRTGEGRFSDCLTIPADAHSARELTQIQQVSGTPDAGVSVLDETGKQVCRFSSYNSWTTCVLTPGLAHTALLQGSDAPAEYALTRRDVTATARGCVTTPATAVGGPSTGGVPAAPGTFRCHQVTTADAGDTLHLNTRDVLQSARLGVYDADGQVLCGYFTRGCAVSGSTRYQALVVVREGETPAPGYRLDALRIGTATGPAPECVKVPSVSYGFGPLNATLSEQKSAVCAVLPTATNDRFDLRLAPSGTVQQMPTPWLYHDSPAKNGCTEVYGSASGSYTCSLPSDATQRQARPSTLVIGLPEVPAQPSTAMRAEFVCTWNLCGPEEWSAGTVGPASVGKGPISLKVTGTALHEQDKVFLSRADGTFRVLSAGLSVSADRRTATAAVDLTSAPPGPLSVTVVRRNGPTRSMGTLTVVAALRNTAPASFTGTAVVGGKVTAKAGTWSLPVDSLAYQWRANGVAVAGATASAYTVPASLQGKSLSVSVVARKAGHPTLTSTSAAVAVKGVAPKATRVPVMTGAVKVGARVSVSVGTWSPVASSYGYQWRADGVAISGATGSAYTPTAAVRGKKLTVTVTAHRTGHLSGSATTAGVTVAYGVAPQATKAPYLTGTVRVGRTLTLNRGTWTPAPTSYAYQWYANGRAVSGATKSTFVPGKAQRGQKITVKVTAHRTGHTSGYAWTRATGAVAG